jgi:hypothetical protein
MEFKDEIEPMEISSTRVDATLIGKFLWRVENVEQRPSYCVFSGRQLPYA